MKIKKIISQYRRDMHIILECEHCGFETNGMGYDDSYFHETVIPNKKCPECNMKADEDYRPLKTKYPDGMLI